MTLADFFASFYLTDHPEIAKGTKQNLYATIRTFEMYLGRVPLLTHPNGLMWYAGEREIPRDVLHLRGYKGKQTMNRYSHWIWRQYASAFWDDVRIKRVLPYKMTKEPDDEKHVHPLQLDVIERCIVLWSNPGEVVFTPFMGVGSEVYGAIINDRKGIGVELKPAYYKQAKLNVAAALDYNPQDELQFGKDDDEEIIEGE